jgi:Tol biopolymer transport system component
LGDGLFVAFESDATDLTAQCNNAFAHIFVRDLTNGRTTCASVDVKTRKGNGDSVNPAISDDGRLVAFESDSNNLVKNDTNGLLDVFVHVLP